MNNDYPQPISRKILLATAILAGPIGFGLGFWAHQDSAPALSRIAIEAKLQKIDPSLVVKSHEASPVEGLSIIKTNKGLLVVANAGNALVRGTLEDLETGRDLLNNIRKPLPFLGNGRHGHTGKPIRPMTLPAKWAGATWRSDLGDKPVSSQPEPALAPAVQPEVSPQGVATTAEIVASSEGLKGGLTSRLAALKAERERKEAEAAAAASQGSDLARTVMGSGARVDDDMPPPGAIPKVGFDNQGKPVSEAQKKHQLKALMSTLPEHWMMVYEAPQATSTITVLTDPTCPYCRRLHSSIQELNAAGITVRYLFFPRYLGAGDRDPRAVELVAKINDAWCSSNPKQALDVLFSGGSAGRSCSDLPEDDKRPRNPAADHYTLGQVLNVSGTPHIIHDSGEVWVGFGTARELIGLVRKAEAAAKAK